MANMTRQLKWILAPVARGGGGMTVTEMSGLLGRSRAWVTQVAAGRARKMRLVVSPNQAAIIESIYLGLHARADIHVTQRNQYLAVTRDMARLVREIEQLGKRLAK